MQLIAVPLVICALSLQADTTPLSKRSYEIRKTEVATHLTVLIDELLIGVKARTLVLYSYNWRAVEPVNIPTISLTPVVLLNGTSNYELKRCFNGQIISVVLLQPPPEPAQLDVQLQPLLRCLQRQHNRDLLFVLTGDNRTAWNWLFEWSFRNGFYNVLLSQGPNSLSSFRPFPSVHGLNTTLNAYLAGRNNWRDFHGYSIRTTPSTLPPRALVYGLGNNTTVVSGTMPRVVQLFAARHNATVQMMLKSNTLHYDAWLDCLGNLATGYYDTCADMAYMSPRYTISRTLQLSQLRFMVRFAQPIPRYVYFLAPFDNAVWLLIIISIGYVTLLTSVLSWLQTHQWHGARFFLATLSSIIYINFDFHLLQGHKRRCFIFIVLVVSGFMLANIYLAFLSSILSVKLYEPQLHTLADLRRNNISIMLVSHFLEYAKLFGANSFDGELKDKFPSIVLVPRAVLNEHREQLMPTYGYMNEEDVLHFYMYQQKFLVRPRMKLLDEIAFTLIGGLPIAKNWPFEHLFNEHLSQLFEHDLWARLQAETQEEAVRVGILKFFETEYNEVAPLAMYDLEMPGMLLGCGYMLALLTFMVEWMWHKFQSWCNKSVNN